MSSTKYMSLSALRVVALGLAIAGFATAASAYTLVLRNGRQIQIPDDFVVNGSTLTYEIGPGLQASVQLASIDIDATDVANKEIPGSFSKRAIRSITGSNLLSTPTGQTDSGRRKGTSRVITNKDLEVYKRKRVESERAYDLRRQELGLPTLEESRQQREAQATKAREELQKTIAEQQTAENYWRDRASSLRAEMEAVDAQINFLQNKLNEIPGPLVLGAAPLIYPVAGITTSNIATSLRPQPLPRPSFYSAPTGGPRVNIRANVGGPRFGRPFGFNQNRFHRGRDGRFSASLPYAVIGGWPYQSYNYGYDPVAMLSQLNELKSQQAGLQARWRELEDEARRAGAYPGWLRP